MKNFMMTLVLILCVSLSFAGGKGKFQKAMQKTLAKYESCESQEDFIAVGNEFERIAKAEKKQWLPRYYHVYSYVIVSFREEDKTRRDELLDVAELSLEELVEMAPKEAEVHALRGFYYTARLAVDPEMRGMEYSMLATMSSKKALKLDAENPRARYIDLSFRMGKAEFFGQDPASFCPEIQDLEESWNSYELESPLHPNWGQDQLGRLQPACQ